MKFRFDHKMNEIVNKFLLVGDKIIPKSIQNNLVLNIVLVVHLLKAKKEFTKMILTKLVFIMIRLMVSLKICLKEHSQINF